MLFDYKGTHNTEKTLELALGRAQELEIEYLVIASNSGYTIEKMLELSRDKHLVCVTHHVGFKEPGVDEMKPEMRKKLEEAGVRVLTATHLLAGVDRSLRFKFQGVYPAEIIAHALRVMGQGLKVGVEISSMALDAGLVPHGEEVVAVGGSGRGADTAIVVVPGHSNYFFDTEVKEIICSPRNKK